MGDLVDSRCEYGHVVVVVVVVVVIPSLVLMIKLVRHGLIEWERMTLLRYRGGCHGPTVHRARRVR